VKYWGLNKKIIMEKTEVWGEFQDKESLGSKNEDKS